MTDEIPRALEAYHPGLAHRCVQCGASVVDAVVTPDEPFRCLACQNLPGAPEDELTRAALEDPGPPPAESRPTAWRLVVMLAFAVAALGIVFWMR